MTKDTTAAGLSGTEAARRLAAEGPNSLSSAGRRSGAAIVLGVLWLEAAKLARRRWPHRGRPTR